MKESVRPGCSVGEPAWWSPGGRDVVQFGLKAALSVPEWNESTALVEIVLTSIDNLAQSSINGTKNSQDGTRTMGCTVTHTICKCCDRSTKNRAGGWADGWRGFL